MGKVLENLVAARELISDPKNWTQKTFARNKDGLSVDFDSSHAICWCSVGAIEKQKPSARRTEVTLLNDAATIFVGDGQDCNIVYVNDILGHEAVIEVFDMAIEVAKKLG